MIRTAVSGIKKSQLSEVKSMANPPAAVKLALESVCLMLNCETQDWKQIRAIMVKDSFISTIVNFDTMSITYGIQFLFYLSYPNFRCKLYTVP